MRDCIEKAVLLFVPVNLPDEENCVDNDPRDDQRKENNAEYEGNNLSPVEDHPGDIQSDCQPNQASAQGDKKSYRFGTARNAHSELPETILKDWGGKKKTAGGFPAAAFF